MLKGQPTLLTVKSCLRQGELGLHVQISKVLKPRVCKVDGALECTEVKKVEYVMLLKGGESVLMPLQLRGHPLPQGEHRVAELVLCQEVHVSGMCHVGTVSCGLSKHGRHVLGEQGNGGVIGSSCIQSIHSYWENACLP